VAYPRRVGAAGGDVEAAVVAPAVGQVAAPVVVLGQAPAAVVAVPVLADSVLAVRPVATGLPPSAAPADSVVAVDVR
ncbi:hypothetical protein EGJ54_21300, partial [Pandoraea apista]